MPQGNHHTTPPGLWYYNPTTQSVRKLFMGSCIKLSATLFGLWLLSEYRALAYKYTYKNFIGKTMSLGPLSKLTHEPLSAEEIDRLKEANKSSHQ